MIPVRLVPDVASSRLVVTALTFESGSRPTGILLIGTFSQPIVDVATSQVFLGSLIQTRDSLDAGRCIVCFIGIEVLLSIVIFMEYVWHLFSISIVFFAICIAFWN
jgi:hypothetical protein